MSEVNSATIFESVKKIADDPENLIAVNYESVAKDSINLKSLLKVYAKNTLIYTFNKEGINDDMMENHPKLIVSKKKNLLKEIKSEHPSFVNYYIIDTKTVCDVSDCTFILYKEDKTNKKQRLVVDKEEFINEVAVDYYFKMVPNEDNKDHNIDYITDVHTFFKKLEKYPYSIFYSVRNETTVEGLKKAIQKHSDYPMVSIMKKV